MKITTSRSLLVVLAAGLTACPAPVKPIPPPAPPVITTFTATPGAISAPGERVTLRWETREASSLTLEQLGVGPLAIDAAAAEGSLEVVLEGDAVFLLTARGPGGTDSRGAGVRLTEGQATPVFTAIPPEVDSGQQVSLVWSAPGSTEVSLRPAGGAPIELGAQREAGAITVTPASTTTYELTVDGRQVTTTVTVRPAIHQFSLQGQTPLPGGMLTLAWRTGGGEALTLTRKGLAQPLTTVTGAEVAQGTFVDTAPASLPRDALLEYTLTLTQGTRSVSAELAVRLDGAVSIDAFIAPTFARANESFGVSWRTTGATRAEVLVDGQPYFVAPDAATATTGGVNVTMSGAMVTVELIVRDDRGGSARQSRTVAVVGSPSFNAFTASPPSIATGGEPVVLSWDVTNARSVRIVSATGEVLHQASGLVDTGSVTLYPNEANVTYELRADNAAGESVPPQQLTVAVGTPATLTFSQLGPIGAPTEVTGTTVPGTGALSGLPTVQQNLAGEGFVDISTTGTSIAYSGPDTTAKVVTLPESFSTVLYGQPVTGDRLSISINGWFVFSATALSGADDNTPFPSIGLEPLAIAPYWEDLYDTADSEIFVRLDGSGPGRRLIVQWNEVEHDAYPGSKLTFQAQVYASGKIVFAYSRLEGVLVNEPSVGIVSPGETAALAASVAPSINDTFTFFAARSPPVPVTIDGLPMRARAVLGTSFIDVRGNPFSSGGGGADGGTDGGVSCGNGIVEGGEGCDDGAMVNGDGCSSACTPELGYACTGAPSLCRPRCGDGLIVAPETCDDSDSDPLDGCSASCTIETGYTCAGLPSLCRAICGDGLVGLNEACDDGNLDPSDGCSELCTVERGRFCSGAPSTCVDVGDVTSVALNGTSADVGHGCLSTSTGLVFCWGAGSQGQLGDGTLTVMRVNPDLVPGLTDVEQVATGASFSCGRRRNGTVACWGDNAQLQLGRGGTSTVDQPTADDVLAITSAAEVKTGNFFACARLTDGTVSCWGDNASLQMGAGVTGTTDRSTPAAVPGLTDVTDLALGGAHACAVLGDGGVRCWGENANGQLGVGGTATTDLHTPTSPVGLPPVTQLCAGEGHTCAVTSGANPELYCWGVNTNGQLGDGTGTAQRQPTLVNGITPRAVACGEQFTCVIELSGRVSCWGQNTTGQLGDGTVSTRRLTPAPVVMNQDPAVLALGFAGACALYPDGARYCWGQSEDGQLGTSVPLRQLEPTPVLMSDVSKLAVTIASYRFGHVCAITSTNDLWCWGENDWGQLGDGTLRSNPTPSPVPSLAGSVVDVANSRGSALTNPGSTCAVLTDGGVSCWGGNNEGQLGDTTNTNHVLPEPAAIPVPATSIVAGLDFYCSTHVNQEVRCWGNNSSGQLGTPPATPRLLTPTVIPGLTGAVELAAGQDHVCARLSNGEVACVGENSEGQLGVDSTVDSSVPTLVPGLAHVEQICSGQHHMCALIAGGTLQCWGQNQYGQMGNGLTTDLRVPTPVAGVTGATSVACGNNYVCAVVSGGAVQCFGYGLDGQMGNGGNTNNVLSPVYMSGITGAVAVTGGNSGTYVLLSDGTVRAMGFTGYGQLGTGPTMRPTVPTLVSPF